VEPDSVGLAGSAELAGEAGLAGRLGTTDAAELVGGTAVAGRAVLAPEESRASPEDGDVQPATTISQAQSRTKSPAFKAFMVHRPVRR